MTDRKLIKLIQEAEDEYMVYEMAKVAHPIGVFKSREEYISDFLIANGVIVPPCKVGDYVEWDNGLGYKTLKRINGFYYDPDDGGLRFILDDCSPIVAVSNITKILTREEAEKALERSK